ncbi:LOW QUALITY PROTEIN: hypothetical protein TorRG33x02_300160 [Trema orientale]|uniref:Uncharacterized protein n=1 Tax=Trema orientale TaxID=63057 RepID=A0A2P5C2A2_TREOI|nr:LOW QUALITY PROTEIN: hypothetical protein TorRG33x02_300160 [Trema orientale]
MIPSVLSQLSHTLLRLVISLFVFYFVFLNLGLKETDVLTGAGGSAYVDGSGSVRMFSFFFQQVFPLFSFHFFSCCVVIVSLKIFELQIK